MKTMNRIRGTANGHELIPKEETEEYQVHKRAMDRFAAMSDEEKFRTFVKAGIYTEEGELTKRYGGTAPNPENGQ